MSLVGFLNCKVNCQIKHYERINMVNRSFNQKPHQFIFLIFSRFRTQAWVYEIKPVSIQGYKTTMMTSCIYEYDAQ